jgi:hypothetical protein
MMGLKILSMGSDAKSSLLVPVPPYAHYKAQRNEKSVLGALTREKIALGPKELEAFGGTAI